MCTAARTPQYHARWRHFEAGAIDRRAAALKDGTLEDGTEGLRAQLDLVVTSVLLDAGAGSVWKYDEPGVWARPAWGAANC